MDSFISRRQGCRVIDTTFSVGGERVAWRFGESDIRAARSLLQRSGVDIVECGLLCSYNAGVDCTIWETTWLPAGAERNGEQLFALLLDRYSRPRLDSIPERAQDTVDIIRMFFTSEDETEDLEYCRMLMDKGYLVAVMIDEPAQYDAECFTEKMVALNDIHPWCCTLFDRSGLMTESMLQNTLSIMARHLADDIAIGFQGRDNLQFLPQLFTIFLAAATDRELVVDTAVGGLSASAPQIDTVNACRLLNERCGRGYLLCALDYLKDLLLKHIKPMISSESAYFYLCAAQEGCAYTYADYYLKNGIPAEELVGILSCVRRRAAYSFDEISANCAMRESMRRKTKIVIITITKAHPLRIERMLSHSAKGMMKCGIDWIILDGSNDARTAACVRGFQASGLINLAYQRASRMAVDDSVQMRAEAYRLGMGYDYIWVLDDDFVPTINECYYELLCALRNGTDLLMVDALYRNGYRRRNLQYKKPADFFEENSNRLANPSQYIMRTSLAATILERHTASGRNGTHWLMESTLHEIAEREYQMGLLVSLTFFCRDNTFVKRCECGDAIQIWGHDWYDAVNRLPEDYSAAKRAAVRFRTPDIQPFHVHSLLGQRAQGYFCLARYKQNKARLLEVGDTPEWKYVFAAVMPKRIAGKLYGIYVTRNKKSAGFFGKAILKVKDLFVRLAG